MKLLAITAIAFPLLAAPAVVIQNATVLTVTKGTFQGISANPGRQNRGCRSEDHGAARRDCYRCQGKFVMPGIIDCHSHIAAESINEGSISVSSMVGIEDVLNPEDPAIFRDLAGGVTTAAAPTPSAESAK